MKKKYLFFDIDGTLVAGGYDASYIPDSTLLAIDKMRKAGHFLCIATGRSQAMADGFRQRLNFENMISDGGNGLTLNGEFLGVIPLIKEDVVALIRECQRKGYPWSLQLDNSKVRCAPDESFQEATHDVYLKTRVVEGLDPENCENIYKAYIACPEPKEQTLEALKKLPWCRYHKEYLFVEPTDKGNGIKRMMDHLQAPYEDVIVFGDNNNDLSMFLDDWYKVAMGNATDALKAKADLITDTVDRDGLYKACERLNLFDAERME